MTQTAIPFLFMRGGTSRGPYMNRADLPDLLRVLGPNSVATMDYRPERMNVHVDASDIVTQITCG